MTNVTVQSALPSFERVPSWTRQTPGDMHSVQTGCSGDPSVLLENSTGVSSRLVDCMFRTCNPPVLAAGDTLCLLPFITCSTSSICATQIQLTCRCFQFLSVLTGVSYVHAVRLAPTYTMDPRSFPSLGPLSALHSVRCFWGSYSSIQARVQHRNTFIAGVPLPHSPVWGTDAARRRTGLEDRFGRRTRLVFGVCIPGEKYREAQVQASVGETGAEDCELQKDG